MNEVVYPTISDINMEFKGYLRFINFHTPIELFDDNNQLIMDIWPPCDQILHNLNGWSASMTDDKTHFEIKADPDSNSKLNYEYGPSFVRGTLDHKTGMSNMIVYMENSLHRMNARRVKVKLCKNKIRFEVDENDDVYGVWYTRNNSCAVPEADVKKICQPGTHNTCIFLTMSGDGFECSKFDSVSARMILSRHGKGEMKASRIGNCKLLGRNEPPAPKITLDKWPELQALVANKEKYIGWNLEDSGDSMDRAMFGGEKMLAKVTDITFELNDDETSASFQIVADKFTCGFNVKYGGGVRRHTLNDKVIEFYGFMGHEFKIYE